MGILARKIVVIICCLTLILSLSGCPPPPIAGGSALTVEFSNEGRILHRNLPIFFSQPDEDQDGIYDPWEIEAVRLINPDIVLDEEEDLLRHDDHHVINFVRVTPIGNRHVLFIYAIALSEDYGRFCQIDIQICRSHEGDVERVIIAPVIAERLTAGSVNTIIYIGSVALAFYMPITE